MQKKFLYLMIFSSSAAHLALSTLKNHQILQKNWEKKWRKNLPIITSTYILLKRPLLEPKMFTVHCVEIKITFKNSNTFIILILINCNFRKKKRYYQVTNKSKHYAVNSVKELVEIPTNPWKLQVPPKKFSIQIQSNLVL